VRHIGSNSPKPVSLCGYAARHTHRTPCRISSSLITVEFPVTPTERSGCSGYDSRVHSPLALVPDSHLSPALWTPLQKLLFPITVFAQAIKLIASVPYLAQSVKSSIQVTATSKGTRHFSVLTCFPIHARIRASKWASAGHSRPRPSE
jgi:hypothetical protein